MRSDQTLETDTERNREVKDNAKVFSLSGGRAGSVEELILEGREGFGGAAGCLGFRGDIWAEIQN